MRRPTLLTATFAALFAFTTAAQTETIPAIRSKALDDSEVNLPRPSSQQLVILIMGFSKKSGDICLPWSKRIASELLLDPRVNYYQIPHLEGAPRLIKPMILHGMKSELTPQQQSHFVPLYDHQADWKQLVHYSAPDDAYLILLAPHGEVLWQSHGSFSESTYSELKKSLSSNLQKISR